MKFEGYDCWKHKHCLDAFIFVSTVIQDDNNAAILHAHWMIQGTEGHWMATNRKRIFIRADHYDNWVPYEPKGLYRSY